MHDRGDMEEEDWLMDSLFLLFIFFWEGRGTEKEVKRVKKNKAEGNDSADSSSWESGFQKCANILW